MSNETLKKIFNTALVATRVQNEKNTVDEIYSLMESEEFLSILSAIKDLSINQGITPRRASEKIIQTFRKLDKLWKDQLVQQGVDSLCHSDAIKN